MIPQAVTPIRPKILIFRNELLPRSETFIDAQARALRHFEPIFAGVHPALTSLPLAAPPLFVDRTGTPLGKLRRRLFWRYNLAPAFYRALKQLHPALLHAHFALDGAAALPLAAALRVPLVVTLHGYDVTASDRALSRSEEGRLYLRRRPRLWRQAAVFLCISEFIRQQALAKGFPAEKLRVLYTGTDLSLFTADSQPRDPNRIVFVGRLVEKKGCNHLLDALAIVQRQNPAVRLALIGAGPLEPALRARIEAERLPCDLLGMLPPHEVKQHLARGRVFCVPSLTAPHGDSEGLGMVFAEALAMGTPVASFRHGGIPEVVLHNETGLLAPEGDTPALAQNLLTLLTDDAAWHRYSQNGPSWVHRTFDLATQTTHLEALYISLLL